MLRIVIALAALVSVSAWAAESETAQLEQQLRQIVPNASPDSIRKSPLAGVYEVVYGTQVLYVSGDGKIALQGRMIDLQTRNDLTEPVLNDARKRAISKVPESLMLVYEPKGEAKYTITTFTDIDCPYCRRMHAEIDELNDAGVRVRYMLFPRSGANTPSYHKAVSVWCAKDRLEALTLSKAGQQIEAKTCENPVDQHMELAQVLGLSGTPMTVAANGEVIRGYVAPKVLVERLAKLETN
jgi:thiol:disulfide interchange protein DsbC